MAFDKSPKEDGDDLGSIDVIAESDHEDEELPYVLLPEGETSQTTLVKSRHLSAQITHQD